MVAPSTPRRLAAGFESLEERAVMSGLTAVVVDGTLTVTGTVRNETIRLSVLKDNLQVAGVKTNFALASFQSITIDGGGGLDTVLLDRLTTPQSPWSKAISVKAVDGSLSVLTTKSGYVHFGGAGEHLLQIDSLGTVLVDGRAPDWFERNVRDRALREMAQAGFVDGRLSRDEMLSILNQVAADRKMTTNEFADLRSLALNNSLFQSVEYVGALLKNVVLGNNANRTFQGKSMGNLRANSAITHLEQLVGKWFLGADRPVAKVGATTFTYTVAAGTLFGDNGPSYTDVRQGYVGDCWLVGAFAELAHQSPSVIQNMFIVNGDGTYTARFFNNGRAEYVTVDSQLPVDRNGRLVFANLGSQASDAGNVLWVALAEKAYVQMSESGFLRGRSAINSYAVISGGIMSDALTQITGRTASSYWMPKSATASFDVLRAAYDAGKCVGLATGNAVASSLLVARHQFVMVGYNAESRTITVFNPWGVDNGTSKPGLITMNQDEVFANFIYWSRSA